MTNLVASKAYKKKRTVKNKSEEETFSEKKKNLQKALYNQIKTKLKEVVLKNTPNQGFGTRTNIVLHHHIKKSW